MRFHPCLSLILACTLTGCLAKLPTGTSKSTTREGTLKSSIVGKTVKPPTASELASTAGAGIVSNNSAGIVSNNAGSLAGVVKAPAGIISNNSGGIISNNSGGYRVLATEQVPVASVRVHLRTATGEAVLGTDGKPMIAVTDSKGKYSFAGFVPTRNLILQVELTAELGKLSAIVSKSNSDKQTVDLDLVSTLVTGYILDQYVKGQADQQQTLDKLPADVEKETRTKAAAALEAGVAVPDKLTAAEIVKTVNAMRQKDTTFDGQMETVKKLLIAAGQSDMGNGRPATEVSLGYVEGLLVGPNGTVYLAAAGDRRVWRVNANGRIEAYAGNGTPDGGNLNGKKAVDAGYASPSRMAFDNQGRLLIQEAGYDDYPVRRLTRIEADGTITQLETGSQLVLAGAGDELWLFKGNIGNQKPTLSKLGADKTVQLFHTFTTEETTVIRNAMVGGKDAQGRLYIGANVSGSTAVYRFDPVAKTFTRLHNRTADSLQGLGVDPSGNIFMVDAAGVLKVQKPDGSVVKLLDKLPEGVVISLERPYNVSQVQLAPDGTAYFTQNYSRVYQIKNGQVTLVAGVDTATGDNAQNLALQEPTGVAMTASGDMIVGDAGLHQLIRIKSDNTVVRLAGTGLKGFSGDGGAATDAKLDMPMSVRVDGAGNVYFIDNDGYQTYRVRKITTNGTITTLKTSEDIIADLVVATDGTLYYRNYRSIGMWEDEVTVERMAPNGTVTMVIPASMGLYRPGALALGPDGALYAHDSQNIYKWTAAAGATLFKTDERFRRESAGHFAVDSQGRIYLSDRNRNQVARYTLATDVFEIIAGSTGAHFNGTGVDDSLEDPCYPTFDAAGNLYITDTGHKQVKRIAADKLR